MKKWFTCDAYFFVIQLKQATFTFHTRKKKKKKKYDSLEVNLKSWIKCFKGLYCSLM